MLTRSYYNSPVGWLELIVSDDALMHLRFLETEPDRYPRHDNHIIQQTAKELSEYFDGSRKAFTIPLDPEGTDFQHSVWRGLREIPYGQTTTYGELARKLGDPNKMRAVGRANGQNPIPIIIPCHRVIGTGGNLIGYGGGIVRKQFLLQHEGALLL